MIFRVVAVGRVRDADLRAACDQYAARTRRYIKLEIHEVPEGGRKSGPPEVVRRVEADSILGAVPRGSRTVALTRCGVAVSSLAFADRINRWQEAAQDVAFLIGGAHGLDESAVVSCDESLSLSSMTLPHELARLVFLEQLYRGGTILRGEPYHKRD